jgi:hypothetical protein
MSQPHPTRALGWIPYRRAEEILTLFDALMNEAESSPRVCLLAGPPNNGKTALADRMAATHPPSLQCLGPNTNFPVLCLETPPTPAFRRLFKSAIWKTGALAVTCDRMEAIEYLGTILKAIHTRMIVLDQAQNILATTPFQRDEFLGFLLEVAQRAKAAVVLVGTVEVLELGPLIGRFDVASLPAWPLNDEFQSMVEALESGLPDGGRLGATGFTPIIHRLSEGRLGELVALLTAVSGRAIEGAQAQLDARTLDAWVPPSKRFERIHELL